MLDQEQYPILARVDSPEDVKQLKEEELPLLADDIRRYMIETVSKTGGHLASSLGAVEIIIAMHRVFNSPEDKLVFDVGHQAYAHKILTGRKDSFGTLRQKDGISGFPKRSESIHDSFDTGHASTSVSAALGMARAKVLKDEPGCAVALIGDGAMTGGMFFEALNDAGQKEVPLVVILNDNDMSISKNVGALRARLSAMRLNRTYVQFKRSLIRTLDTSSLGKWLSRHMDTLKTRIKNFLLPDLLFEEFGFVYLGPIDGHNIKNLTEVFRLAKDVRAPVIVHAVTQKGKGYCFSENDPEKFHGVAPFDLATGLAEKAVLKSNSDVFGDALTELARTDNTITAITAAMPGGTGLINFSKTFPDRFFDVGIAEEHALTMAAGMAAGGLSPVVAIYSSFLQRGYDQLMHDICLQKLPVVVAIDRAGLVGNDGETHQGIFDPVLLSTLPNMTVFSPASQEELVTMLKAALSLKSPACIRYTRGHLVRSVGVGTKETDPLKWEVLKPLSDINVIATGPMVSLALEALKDTEAGLINARTFKPVDETVLQKIKAVSKTVIVMEENIPCLYPSVSKSVYPIMASSISIPVTAVTHASVSQQRENFGLTKEHLLQLIKEAK